MRAPKKSETIEVRLPHAAKQAFMDRCRDEGCSASEAVRQFIDSYVQPQTAVRRGNWRWIVGALSAGAVAAVAAPSLARPSLPGEFQRLDTDGSGTISSSEFSRAASLSVSVSVGSLHLLRTDSAVRGILIREEFNRIDSDHDGKLSLAEFRQYYGR